MFDIIGPTEIVLIAVLFVVLFNSRDMMGIIRLLGKSYARANQYFYKLKSEIMYEPPTGEELKSIRETEEMYKKYSDDPESAAGENTKKGGEENSPPPPDSK